MGMELEKPIKNTDDLVEYFYSGCKPRDQWKIGLEHEVLLYKNNNGTMERADYESGIRNVLKAFVHRYGWSPYEESGNIIAAHKDGAAITLEPGGQLELSGAPHSSIIHVKKELDEYNNQLDDVLKSLDLHVRYSGYDSITDLSQRPMMPKARYGIMWPYMKKIGDLGQEMMTGTATVQANLDYESEADMIKKFRVAVGLQSFFTAIFANSPFKDFASYRRHIWTKTDDDRCGLPLFVFSDDMSFYKYATYVMNVPMYFIVRDGAYINMTGITFKDFLSSGAGNHQPILDDWVNHCTTIFTEVRMKSYLEMRGADCVPRDRLIDLASLWVSILYDEATLDKAYDFVMSISYDDMQKYAELSARYGISMIDYMKDGQWPDFLPR